MSYQAILLRLMAAAFLGALVGLERHWADKSAGMRTHMLVSLGSALIMIVSAHAFDDVLIPSRVVLDPSRVAAQVVSGVGFLGAGMILRRNSEVHGLTTAAGIWAAAGIGLGAGGGLYFAAAAGTALILLILTAIKPLEERLAARSEHHTVNLLVKADAFSLKDCESIVREAGLELKGISMRRSADPGKLHVTIDFGHSSGTKMVALVERLTSESSVRKVSFEVRRT